MDNLTDALNHVFKREGVTNFTIEAANGEVYMLTDEKEPEVIEKIVEVPVEKIVEKVVVKEVEVPRGPSEPEKLAEAMSLVHKGQMLPEEKSELEKLKEEFGHFRKLVNMQLSSLGGGGSTHILDMDDVDISSLGNGKFLKYNSTSGKLEFSDTVGTYTFS